MHKPTWCQIETLCSMHVYRTEAEGLSSIAVVAVNSIRKNPRVDRGELPRFLLRVFHLKGLPCQ